MIYVLGGGGTGATLVVTGVAGSTCTITKDGKSYTKIFGADKKVTFKGLATGIWTVTMTNGTSTASKSVTVRTDYAVMIAYFTATISVTYPANSTCIIKSSDGSTIATNTNSKNSTKTFTATVNSTGTYTVSATSADGSKSKSGSVSITADGQTKTITLAYELVLFENGKLSATLGALKNKNLSTYKIENGKITCARTGSNAGDLTGYGSFTLPVDLTSRKNLYIRVSSENYPTYTKFGIEAKANTNTFAASQSKTKTASETLTIPVSSFSGSYNILVEITGLGDPSFGALTTTAYIEKMWLV